MNHNGNANKMVSDTPRTDDESFFMHHSRYDFCKADLARQLERELTAAKQRIKRLYREVELLRLYGNKDCTAMADDALRKEAKP